VPSDARRTDTDRADLAGSHHAGAHHAGSRHPGSRHPASPGSDAERAAAPSEEADRADARRTDSHCSTCGTAYPDAESWPRTCAACGHTAYHNPLPVAVCLLPVHDIGGTGLVVIRRTIAPALGRLALPGGFIDFGESWQQGAVRELAEETGIVADAADVALADALTDTEGGYLLLFGLLPPRAIAELPASAATDETEGYQILYGEEELGFPLHTLAVRRWFGGDYAYTPRSAPRSTPRTRTS
jgi:8-oxo-dGTP pyrophosphatase MutT (NUDIX family)